MNTVKSALTRKFGPLPAYAWLGLFAVGVYWWRSRHGSATGAATASGNTDLGALADLGYTAVPSQLLDSGGSSGGGTGGSSSTGTPAKPKRKPPRPKRRHHKARARARSHTPTHHRPAQPLPPHHPVRHPRQTAPAAFKPRAVIRRKAEGRYG